MNHILTDFTSSRLLPKRALHLPLKLISDKHLSVIVNGRCLLSNNNVGVLQSDEVSLDNVLNYNVPEHFHAAHGFTDSGFLLTDNNGALYIYKYDNPEPISHIENVGLYFLKGESHWIDHSHSIHMHGSEGVSRNRISGEKYICLFDWDKKAIIWKVKPAAISFDYAISTNKFVYQTELEDGSVHCLDLHTGETCWIKSPHDLVTYSDEENARYETWQKAIKGSPHIYKNLVIVGLPFFRIVAIDISTGKTVWEYKLAWDEYDEPLFNIDSRPYEMAVTEGGRVYRIESVDVICGYDKHCQRLFLIELAATTGNLIQRLEVKAPEGDLQTHIIDPFKKENSFGQERYCDVSKTHYLTSFEGGLVMAINLKTGIVDWHTTLPTGTAWGPFFLLNNRLYTSTGWHSYVFEGEGGYIPD